MLNQRSHSRSGLHRPTLEQWRGKWKGGRTSLSVLSSWATFQELLMQVMKTGFLEPVPGDNSLRKPLRRRLFQLSPVPRRSSCLSKEPSQGAQPIFACCPSGCQALTDAYSAGPHPAHGVVTHSEPAAPHPLPTLRGSHVMPVYVLSGRSEAMDFILLSEARED